MSKINRNLFTTYPDIALTFGVMPPPIRADYAIALPEGKCRGGLYDVVNYCTR
jgi:hypothetical protein